MAGGTSDDEVSPDAPTRRADRSDRGTRIAWAPPLLATLRVRVPFVVALMLAAFLLRAIAAVVVEQALYAAGRDGFLGVDDVGYDNIAWQQAQAWRGIGPGVPLSEQHGLHVYTYTEAALYLVVGHQPLAMKLVNCLLGALAAGIIYLITQRLFGEVAARFSAAAAAFFPSTFFWSVVNLKDILFLFIVVVLMWCLTELVTTARRGLIVPMLFMLALSGGVRIYIQGLLSALIPLTIILQSRRQLPQKWVTTAVLSVSCVTILWFSGGVQWLGVYFPLLNNQRYNMAGSANSAYVPTPVPTTMLVPTVNTATPTGAAPNGPAVLIVPTGAGSAPAPVGPATATPAAPIVANAPMASPHSSLIRWIPMGLVYALAAPFPWSATRTIERVTIPDMLLWYVALALAVLGLLVHWRSWRCYVHLLGYLAGVLLIFAIGQGNLGTLVRQRSTMFLPFMLIFSGAGAAWLWSYARTRRSVPAIPPEDPRRHSISTD